MPKLEHKIKFRSRGLKEMECDSVESTKQDNCQRFRRRLIVKPFVWRECFAGCSFSFLLDNWEVVEIDDRFPASGNLKVQV